MSFACVLPFTRARPGSPAEPTKKVDGGDDPPREATVTNLVPTVETSAAGTRAVNSVAERYLVTKVLPFHLTPEPRVNPSPVTSSTNPASPATADPGLKVEIDAVRSPVPSS